MLSFSSVSFFFRLISNLSNLVFRDGVSARAASTPSSGRAVAPPLEAAPVEDEDEEEGKRGEDQFPWVLCALSSFTLLIWLRGMKGVRGDP